MALIHLFARAFGVSTIGPAPRPNPLPEGDMTHSGGKPHTNVGDRGQRYELLATGYPKADESVIGWATTLEGADEMADAIRQHPSCTSTTIRDRQEDGRIITRFAGILR